MRTCLAAVAALVSTSPAVAADPVALSAFQALPRPAPSHQIQYGDAQAQAIDIFLPPGAGPHPVAILIHGGCWSAATDGRGQLRHLGTDLARRGIAVWSTGYRRADEPGGGYPGTFLDVGTAIDRLRDGALRYGLDVNRTVLVGHSAGGHLALWAAARGKLPVGSAIGAATPFEPRAVISLAGVGDLASFSRFVPVLCGAGIIERLSPPGMEAETSPAALAAPDVPVTLISAELDRLVPPYVAHDYAVAMRGKRKASMELFTIAGAGHFDLVTPGASAWAEVRRRIEGSLAVVP